MNSSTGHDNLRTVAVPSSVPAQHSLYTAPFSQTLDSPESTPIQQTRLLGSRGCTSRFHSRANQCLTSGGSSLRGPPCFSSRRWASPSLDLLHDRDALRDRLISGIVLSFSIDLSIKRRSSRSLRSGLGRDGDHAEVATEILLGRLSSRFVPRYPAGSACNILSVHDLESLRDGRCECLGCGDHAENEPR